MKVITFFVCNDTSGSASHVLSAVVIVFVVSSRLMLTSCEWRKKVDRKHVEGSANHAKKNKRQTEMKQIQHCVIRDQECHHARGGGGGLR